MRALTSLLRRPSHLAGVVLPSSVALEEKHQPRIKSGVKFALAAILLATPASASTGEAATPAWPSPAACINSTVDSMPAEPRS